MNNINCDWRIQGQESYLFAKTLEFKSYSERKSTTDHDHCEFCSEKFSDTIPDCLNSGYTTTDDYYWICTECFLDFNVEFKWTVIKA